MGKNSDGSGKDKDDGKDNDASRQLSLVWALDREACALFHKLMRQRFGKIYEDGKPSRDLTFDEAVDRYLMSITSTLEDDLNSYKQSTAISQAIIACERVKIAGTRI